MQAVVLSGMYRRHPIGGLLGGLRHSCERDECGRSPRLVGASAAADEKRFVNRRTDREVRALGIVAGYDEVNVEAVGEEFPLVDSGGAGAGGGGENLAQNARVLAQQRIGQRRKEGPYAVRVDEH